MWRNVHACPVPAKSQQCQAVASTLVHVSFMIQCHNVVAQGPFIMHAISQYYHLVVHAHLLMCQPCTSSAITPVCTRAVSPSGHLVTWVCNCAHLAMSQSCHVVAGSCKFVCLLYPTVTMWRPRHLLYLSITTCWHGNACLHACHVPAPSRGITGKPVCMSA